MNLFIKAILIILIYSGALSAQDCKARISIQTDYETAKIFIDDIIIGERNNFEAELEPGLHTIYIVDNFWKWSTKSIRDTIRIIDCNDINLNYSFRNEKLLDTNPQDVYVFKGDSLIGFTPIYLELVPEEFILKKAGYSSKTIRLQEIAEGEKPELQFIGQVKGESFYETTLFKVLVGTALALGATTAYYKLEADKKFTEYQITGNPDLLEQTDRYDVISGVTFVALQINFGLIIYLFLSD
jgi:hypothetical protein